MALTRLLLKRSGDSYRLFLFSFRFGGKLSLVAQTFGFSKTLKPFKVKYVNRWDMILKDFLSVVFDFQVWEIYLYDYDIVVGVHTVLIWRSDVNYLHDLQPYYNYFVRCIGNGVGSRFYITISKE